MAVCLRLLDVSLALCVGWTWLGLCIRVYRGHIGIICPGSNIRIIGSWLSIGIVSSRRHSRWCTFQTSSNIIGPALTQNAESLLWTSKGFDEHDAATRIKFTLIGACILLRHTYSHPVISRVCSGSCLARKQTLEVVYKTVRSALH